MQGLTLTGPVVVDFRNGFVQPHLVYVALSRVRSPEQLTVRGLKKASVIVCPKSMEFEAYLQKKSAEILEGYHANKTAIEQVPSIALPGEP